MSVPYDVFTDAFLSKITEYDFVNMRDFERNSLIDGYMKRAIASFRKICKYDLSTTGDDIIRYMGVEEPAVRAGGRVDAGECIARQSDRVRCEAHLGAHVHIEAVIDGENIDIEPLLQKESAY